MHLNESAPSAEVSFDSPLPITLGAFDGLANGRTIDLSWKLQSNDDLVSVAVEFARVRTSGTEPFVGATTAEAIEPVDGLSQARVMVPEYGRYAFRLKMVDLAGTITYSPVVELDATMESTYAIDPVYPNPTSYRATMTVAVREDQNVTVDLVDMLGRRVRSAFESRLPANSTESVAIETGDLAKGLYLVVTRGATFSDVQKLVVR